MELINVVLSGCYINNCILHLAEAEVATLDLKPSPFKLVTVFLCSFTCVHVCSKIQIQRVIVEKDIHVCINNRTKLHSSQMVFLQQNFIYNHDCYSFFTVLFFLGSYMDWSRQLSYHKFHS